MENPNFSLHNLRLKYQVPLPKILEKPENLKASPQNGQTNVLPEIAKIFPQTLKNGVITFEQNSTQGTQKPAVPLRVAAVFSGGQASGGHNVISGLYDYLKKLHPESHLIGILNGPDGLVKKRYIDITEELINQYRNQGGFDLLGSGRTKIESLEQFEGAEKTVKELNLDGLVIIGGDDSNTNAALLAEFFIARGVKTRVIGVPKTIDGDLKNKDIEISFGFDSATKLFSQLIANIQRDALSAKKYYHFIKLMGRTASHITLECALRTHANGALIGEEIAEKQKSLKEIIRELADTVCERSALGKDYGVFLIPEGILEFIPECKILLKELNSQLSNPATSEKLESISEDEQKLTYVENMLSNASKDCFQNLPQAIRLQLLQDRDPHGNVQVSQIESERLIIEMLKRELNIRKAEDSFKGTFKAVPHFFGYEGRACYPSNFDAQYCYSLGQLAGILIYFNATGYLACIKNLTSPINNWEIKGIPLVSLMALEERNGKVKPVIAKAQVDLNAAPFKLFEKHRAFWALDDDYQYPGPSQYFGPAELTDELTITLQLESKEESIFASLN